MNTTGLSSSTALRSRPYMSAPELGMTTVSPGTWASSVSRLCECWLPDERPEPNCVRTTSGTVTAPPVMKRSLAAWLRSWSKQTPRKSRYISSTTGRRPAIAAPTPSPMIAVSEIGVSSTRPGNSPDSPRVMPKTLPPADVDAGQEHVLVLGERVVQRLPQDARSRRGPLVGLGGGRAGGGRPPPSARTRSRRRWPDPARASFARTSRRPPPSPALPARAGRSPRRPRQVPAVAGAPPPAGRSAKSRPARRGNGSAARRPRSARAPARSGLRPGRARRRSGPCPAPRPSRRRPPRRRCRPARRTARRRREPAGRPARDAGRRPARTPRTGCSRRRRPLAGRAGPPG